MISSVGLLSSKGFSLKAYESRATATLADGASLPLTRMRAQLNDACCENHHHIRFYARYLLSLSRHFFFSPKALKASDRVDSVETAFVARGLVACHCGNTSHSPLCEKRFLTIRNKENSSELETEPRSAFAAVFDAANVPKRFEF